MEETLLQPYPQLLLKAELRYSPTDIFGQDVKPIFYTSSSRSSPNLALLTARTFLSSAGTAPTSRAVDLGDNTIRIKVGGILTY
jgi:hypothetical protein